MLLPFKSITYSFKPSSGVGSVKLYSAGVALSTYPSLPKPRPFPPELVTIVYLPFDTANVQTRPGCPKEPCVPHVLAPSRKPPPALLYR